MDYILRCFLTISSLRPKIFEKMLFGQIASVGIMNNQIYFSAPARRWHNINPGFVDRQNRLSRGVFGAALFFLFLCSMDRCLTQTQICFADIFLSNILYFWDILFYLLVRNNPVFHKHCHKFPIFITKKILLYKKKSEKPFNLIFIFN